jgi:hypothetical protein
LDRRAWKDVVVDPHFSREPKGKEEKTALDRRTYKGVVVDPCLQRPKKVNNRKKPWTGGRGKVWSLTHASRGPKGEGKKTALDRRAWKDVVVDPCLQGAKG